jgi:Zn-dependent protease with chaperone function
MTEIPNLTFTRTNLTSMCFLLFLVFATFSFAQQLDNGPNNYYSLETEAELGERFATRLKANVTAVPDPRLDRIGNILAPFSQQFHYSFFVFDGGTSSEDTAPAAAFPSDWRRLELDEAIAVASGAIFVPRRLLSRGDVELTAILAHAMGHITLRHPSVGLTRGELAQVEVQIASRAMPDEALQRVRAVAAKRFAFDRACEIGADKYAVELLHNAGLGTPALLKYLQSLPPQPRDEFSVYPSPAERIEAVQARQ